MDLGLKHKVALVVGSTRGIGLAIAAALAREGCKVILNSRDKVRLEAASSGLEGDIDIYPADVTSDSECSRLMEYIRKQYGTLDILVSNVGSGRSVAPGEETLDEWKRVLDINLLSATNIVTAARDIMTRGTGSVLCVSSICGIETLGAPLTYSAAKAALNSYVKGVSRVLGADGIRINAIAPGNILDEGGTWERKIEKDRQSVENMLDKEVALGRLGTPEEIADFAIFLVSGKASFATGAIFIVDGGQVRS